MTNGVQTSKGHFRTLDQRRIDPLTMTESHSRFLLEVRIVPPTIEGTLPAFAAVFREDGLPRSIRCDNGPPFGSTGAAALTRLSAWWAKLGIELHFIHPASPQENGRHERMHRTLKHQTSCPPAANAVRQQARINAFRRHYNEERPHEALGQQPPAALYTPSLRPLPRRIEDPWYDTDHQVRRVRRTGEIRWRGENVFVSEALCGELVGSPSSSPATLSCGSATSTLACSTAVPASAGSLRRVRGSANRQPRKCRESSRSKMSTINPVEQGPNPLTPALSPPGLVSAHILFPGRGAATRPALLPLREKGARQRR